MAGLHPKNDSRLSLEIRTKSVEQTLVPLVTQITTLVNHREKPRLSERTQYALERVGQAVNMAVGRFVAVGDSIVEDHPELRQEMEEACHEARSAGENIQLQTAVGGQAAEASTSSRVAADKTAMVRAARQLLSAITKVLLLADRIVIKTLIASKDRVLHCLAQVEGVSSFQDFVATFSQFGKHMVELAHLSGDRQNDLKSEKQKAQMGSARAILEKSTMMLLTSCKTCLRHPECRTARMNRDAVFLLIRNALDLVQHVVTDGGAITSNGNISPTLNGDSGIGLSSLHPTASRAFKELEELIDMARVTMIDSTVEDKLWSSFELAKETVDDFTDSPYTSHDNRERVLQLTEKLRDELQVLLMVGRALNAKDAVAPTQDLETAILKTMDMCKSLRKQLLESAMEQASELFRRNEDHELLSGLRAAGLGGEVQHAEQLTVQFAEHQEQLEEVCKLFRHMASSEPLVITADHNESFIHSLGPMILFAAQTLAQYPNSKIARENLEVFADAWESQINDLSILVKEVNDVCQGRGEKVVYLSLPRPGKHGTQSRGLKPVKLDAEEQAKIAKLGLEMKLITSEMEAEADKWAEPDNAVVRRAKNMAAMAFSMYLFTRGEGRLHTTHDLFLQAEFFAEEGNKLYRTVKDFSSRVPSCASKDELLAYVDRVPSLCHQLHVTLKTPTFGKSATFNKVDSAIQETKNLMNIIAKVVTTCFICATKYNIDYRTSPVPPGQRRSRGGSGSYDFRSSGSENELSYSGPSDGLYRTSSMNKPFTLDKTG
ncbi:alpha-catulin-like isoform X2 [Littorina saxatilis]|uniref:alpha-catulin-like isoform X2 n=1 Tax=Littorina saxatilis TaxID=31220 RepID=UPI0038B5789F